VLPCDLSLITIHISDCRQFSYIHISQGSVATYVRCDWMLKYEFVENLPLSLSVKEFWKSLNIWGSYGQDFPAFLIHSIDIRHARSFGLVFVKFESWGQSSMTKQQQQYCPAQSAWWTCTVLYTAVGLWRITFNCNRKIFWLNVYPPVSGQVTAIGRVRLSVCFRFDLWRCILHMYGSWP